MVETRVCDILHRQEAAQKPPNSGSARLRNNEEAWKSATGKSPPDRPHKCGCGPAAQAQRDAPLFADVTLGSALSPAGLQEGSHQVGGRP